MVCIYCNNQTEVYNSRVRKRTPSVWRRRRCMACVAQFSTEELPDYGSSLIVVTSERSLHPFSRDRLFLSIHKSLSHRDDSLKSSGELTATIISKLLKNKIAIDGTINLHDLARLTFLTIKRYDSLAANTYKAYHQDLLKNK